MKKPFLTPNEVAKLLMVAPVTVRQWAQKGLIEARMTAGGHRRFSVEAVQRFARDNGIQLDLDSDDAPDSDGDTLRLLIVDDNAQFNGFLVAFFENLHTDVAIETAFDGFEAGIKVAESKPHIILLDIMMPGLNGVQVCERIKSDAGSRNTRVIAMTGHFSNELQRDVLAAGAEVLLKKPFTMNELLDACGLQTDGTNQLS